MPPLNLHDAGEIRREIVEPVVQAVREVIAVELRQIREEQAEQRQTYEQHDRRIRSLEAFQTRAMATWGLVVCIVTLVGQWLWGKLTGSDK